MKCPRYQLLYMLSCTLWFGASVLNSEVVRAEMSHEHLSRIWQEEFTLPTGQLQSTGPMTEPSDYAPDAHLRSNQPHPAVARVIVPEKGATSYGSGTLIDVRDQFALVITNWHVVRDAQGMVEVMFPGGFTSKARALKVDADWDLAALVIWRPPVEPVPIAATAPRPGDQLTICGYGQGMYRAATGRCTQYYAPRTDFPLHMVELDVEARQGDSGGPIFNRNGELAGVLFGAGQGTTLGSFGGRVDSFLATLAPDIGEANDALASSETREPAAQPFCCRDGLCAPCQNAESVDDDRHQTNATQADRVCDRSASEQTAEQLAAMWPAEDSIAKDSAAGAPTEEATTVVAAAWQPVGHSNWFEQLKTALAAVGVVAIAVLVLRAAR